MYTVILPLLANLTAGMIGSTHMGMGPDVSAMWPPNRKWVTLENMARGLQDALYKSL